MNAVIFDFNGTLFDDTIFHIIAWKDFFQTRFGIAMSEDEVRVRCLEPDNQSIFHSLLKGSYTRAELDALSQDKERAYRAAVHAQPDKMHLVEGAAELFDSLKARGVPFALATSSIWDNVQFYLKDMGLEKWFDLEHIVYEDGKLRSKPEPDFFIEAARRLNTAPADCMVVEDSPTGVRAAASAGIGRIIAIETTHSPSQLSAAGNVHAFIRNFWSFEQFI